MKNIVAALIVLSLGSLSYAGQGLKMESKSGKVEFSAKGPLVRVNGKGPAPSGELTIKDGKATGNLILDLKALDTGISIRDDHMKNKYLEVSKNGYDKATLKLKDVQLPKDLKGKIAFTGMLNLHGVEKAVKGKVKMKGVKKGKAQVDADFKIKFSDFNIELPSFKLASVGEEIKIKVSSTAVVTQ